MTNPISRRDAFRFLATAAGSVAVFDSVCAAADEKPHLALNDPTAMALGYIDDAAKVDVKKNATYKAGSNCSNCLQLSGGTEKDVWRPCNLFPNKLVNSKGWCKVYVKKP
jgi:hypothetical protein